MTIQIDGSALRNVNDALRREWLETNGLGGWASSTLAGAHTRRDHGLLVVAQDDRPAFALLSRLDETLYVPRSPREQEPAHEGADVFELGANVFPGPNVYPRGYEHLASFTRGLFPVFTYEAGPVRLQKTVAALDGEAATVVVYEVLEAPGPFLFELRPFVAARDVRSLAHANATFSREASFGRGILHLAPYADLPELFLKAPNATFHYQPDWWYQFSLVEEQAQEDLFTPGVLRVELAAGDRIAVLAATADPAGRDPLDLFAKERRRREKLLEGLPVRDELTQILATTADQFSLRRSATQRTLAAGYPGADETTAETLIALPGLLLATGRLDDAKKVLRSLVRAMGKGGALTDRLTAAGEPTFASLGGALWMFPAAFRFLAASGDEAFVRETLLPALGRIAAAYERGTAAGVKVGEDGLLAVARGERAGCPVELNALWLEALATLGELETRLGDAAEGKAWTARGKQAARRFVELFWNEETGALFDRIENGEGGVRHAGIDPHQVLVLALPHPHLPKAKASRLLETLETELAQNWTWLLGSLLTALARVHGASGRQRALTLLAEIEPHLLDGCVGTIAEIAEITETLEPEAPHRPHGRIASAASVGELLRAYVEDLHPAMAAKPKAKAAAKVVETKKSSRTAAVEKGVQAKPKAKSAARRPRPTEGVEA